MKAAVRGATRCGALTSSDCARRSDDADNMHRIVYPTRSRVASAQLRVACVGNAAPSISSDDGDGDSENLSCLKLCVAVGDLTDVGGGDGR